MCWLITFTGKPESVCSGHTAFQHSLHRSTEDWECHCTLQRQLSLAVGDFAVLCSCICPAVTVQDLGTVESCILVAYHHQPLQLHLSLVTSARLLILLLQRELLFYFLQHVLLTIVLLLQCYHFCLPKITAAISNGCRCYWVITYLRKPYISALSGSCLCFYSALQLAFVKDVCMQEKDLKQKCNIDGYLVCVLVFRLIR